MKTNPNPNQGNSVMGYGEPDLLKDENYSQSYIHNDEVCTKMQSRILPAVAILLLMCTLCTLCSITNLLSD